MVLYIGEIIQAIIPKRYHSNQGFNSSKAQKRWSLCSWWVRHFRIERESPASAMEETAEMIYGLAKSHSESPWTLMGQVGAWLHTPGSWS